MMQFTPEQHAAFCVRLARSDAAVQVVADRLRNNGRQVEIPETRFAPTAAEAAQYSDSGDVFVLMRQARYRVEVKGLTVNFTGSDDWPFGGRVFVDRVHRVDGAPDVVAYYTVNSDLKHLNIIFPAISRSAWFKVEMFNRVTGRHQLVYACPKHLVIFRAV